MELVIFCTSLTKKCTSSKSRWLDTILMHLKLTAQISLQITCNSFSSYYAIYLLCFCFVIHSSYAYSEKVAVFSKKHLLEIWQTWIPAYLPSQNTWNLYPSFFESLSKMQGLSYWQTFHRWLYVCTYSNAILCKFHQNMYTYKVVIIPPFSGLVL